MKKKGLTLLELILAVSILMIGMTAVSLLTSSALASYKRDKIRIENMNYADTIINIFKSKGKLYVKNIYDNGITSYNIYFSNIDDLEKSLETDPTTDDETSIYTIPANTRGKTNSAYIMIGNRSIIDSDNNKNVYMYSVLIKVWNFKYGENSEVKFEINIGR